MKTAKQILIEKDCYQDSVHDLSGRIITISNERLISAMKKYAEQAVDECINKIDKLENIEKVDIFKACIFTKNELS